MDLKVTNNFLKKFGRRKANTWGRCGSKKEKRSASKGVRKLNKLSIKKGERQNDTNIYTSRSRPAKKRN